MSDERFKDRITELPHEFGRNWCSNATSAAMSRSTRCSPTSARHWDGLDGLVHSIGFAPREAIAGDFLDGLSREAFRIAHDISAYSFPGDGQGRAADAAAASRRC